MQEGVSTCSVLPFPSPTLQSVQLPAPDSSQTEPVPRDRPSRVSTGGSSRLSSSSRLHRGSSALTSLPRVLLRHSLNPAVRNAVHMLCVSCFFPPSFPGLGSPAAGGSQCFSWRERGVLLPRCHGQLPHTSKTVSVFGEICSGDGSSQPPQLSCYPCDVLFSFSSLYP